METEKPDGFPGLPEEFVRQNAKYMRLLRISLDFSAFLLNFA